MHPNPAFRWDEDAARAFVADEGFGLCFATTPDGPRVAQVPVVLTGDGRLRFHLARSNALTPHLDGATALFVVSGPHAYVAPRWYDAGPDEVPTWNYVSVEVEGVVHALDRAGLRNQIDALTAAHEADPPWSVAAMDPAKAAAMLDAIRGFELVPTAWRATAKLNQNKPAVLRERVARALGDHPIARWMRGVALGGALFLGGCGDMGDPAWLLAEARAPGGTRIARLWCADRCDVPGRITLTLSPAGRAVPVEPPTTEGFPPTAMLPEDDVAMIFDAGGSEGAPVAARWTGAGELTVTAPCPVARDGARGDVTVRLRATDCRAPA